MATKKTPQKITTSLNNRRGKPKLINMDSNTLEILERASKNSPQYMLKPYIEEVLRKHAQKLQEWGEV